MNLKEEKKNTDGYRLTEWVLSKVSEWKNHRLSNYDEKWDVYEKIWRGLTNKAGTLADTFISPATQQAVESSVAELEETIFGRGAPFDIRDDVADQDKSDIESTKLLLWDDMQKSKNKVRKTVSESLINAAVYGTGISELQVEIVDRKVPIQVPTQGGPIVSANTSKEVNVKWNTVNPNNFLIDPNATCVSDALGVAIEEYVGRHIIRKAQDAGFYKQVDIPTGATSDYNIEKDKTLTNSTNSDRVKIIKYYGLVPRVMLNEYNTLATEELEVEEIVPPRRGRKERVSEEEAEETLSELEAISKATVDNDDMVEAIVVVVSDSICLKADENPYIMGDRPIIAFPWDFVPGRFWGRGVCEKGINAQMVLDEEIRNRLKTLELTTQPMVGIDATKLPRGFSFKIERGRNVLLNGRPSEIMEPFKIGELDPNTWRNAETMERMVFQSTGAADLSGIPADINGEATAAGMSMAMSGVIKRTKRVILNFFDQYMMPGIQKTAWRYMQFYPEKYKASDYEFIPSTTMGIMAREYEQGQLVQLLSTMQPGSPQYNAVLTGVIENSSLQAREKLLQMINISDFKLISILLLLNNVPKMKILMFAMDSLLTVSPFRLCTSRN